MIRRPRRSPLFPSTTLSRSRRVKAARRRARRLQERAKAAGGSKAAEGADVTAERPELQLEPVHATAAGDRKSTRLNSSHGYISYAVFCLKKKTQNRSAAIAE